MATKEQNDLLIKLCCINHIKLIPNFQRQENNKLLAYLQENWQCHQNYYKSVSWNGIQRILSILKMRRVY